MKGTSILTALLAATALVNVQSSWAGQAPGAANAPDIAISDKDRFYTSDQFSNTVSVIDLSRMKITATVAVGQEPIALAATSKVWVVCKSAGLVQGLDPVSLKIAGGIRTGREPL